MAGILLTAEKVPPCVVCRKDQRDLAGTTCVTRAMNTHVGENDGFVSNDSDSEIRETSAHGAGLVSDVRNFSYREPRVVKRDYSQLSGRTLDDPSAPERRVPAYLANSTGRDWRNMIFCCLVEILKRYLNFYLGIVLGGPSATSCGDGNREACSSLARGTLKSKSLFHTYLLDAASGRGSCPGVADYGNRRGLRGCLLYTSPSPRDS